MIRVKYSLYNKDKMTDPPKEGVIVLSRVPCVGEFVILKSDGFSYKVTEVFHHAEKDSIIRLLDTNETIPVA